jgi:hypothetical protein
MICAPAPLQGVAAMVKPPDGTSEKVRARLIELTGEDPGPMRIADISPGPRYHTLTQDEIVEHLAQSMVRASPKTQREGE